MALVKNFANAIRKAQVGGAPVQRQSTVLAEGVPGAPAAPNTPGVQNVNAAQDNSIQRTDVGFTGYREQPLSE